MKPLRFVIIQNKSYDYKKNINYRQANLEKSKKLRKCRSHKNRSLSIENVQLSFFPTAMGPVVCVKL